MIPGGLCTTEHGLDVQQTLTGSKSKRCRFYSEIQDPLIDGHWFDWWLLSLAINLLTEPCVPCEPVLACSKQSFKLLPTHHSAWIIREHLEEGCGEIRRSPCTCRKLHANAWDILSLVANWHHFSYHLTICQRNSYIWENLTPDSYLLEIWQPRFLQFQNAGHEPVTAFLTPAPFCSTQIV